MQAEVARSMFAPSEVGPTLLFINKLPTLGRASRGRSLPSGVLALRACARRGRDVCFVVFQRAQRLAGFLSPKVAIFCSMGHAARKLEATSLVSERLAMLMALPLSEEALSAEEAAAFDEMEAMVRSGEPRRSSEEVSQMIREMPRDHHE